MSDGEGSSATATGGAVPAPAALCLDRRRAAWATLISIVVPVLAGLCIRSTLLIAGHEFAVTVVLLLAGFTIFALTYVVLTLTTFSGLGPDGFRVRMRARSAAQRHRLGSPIIGGKMPAFALESTVLALITALVLPHIPAISLDDLVLVPITLCVLLSSWMLSIVSYALHYAQRDLERPALEFPGERADTFADYMYFSIAVATTFGATDVNITTPRMRHVVNLNTLLTFVYNTVIVALLASFLVR
jgi:uncharacterized membrane protein